MNWLSSSNMKGFCLQILMIGCTLLVSGASYIHAQELQAKITINHAQISGTDNAVFDNLKQTLESGVKMDDDTRPALGAALSDFAEAQVWQDSNS